MANIEIELKNPIHPGFYYTILDPTENGCEDYELDGLDDKQARFVKEHDLTLEYDYQQYKDEVSTNLNGFFLEKINETIYDYFGVKDLFRDQHGDEVTSPREYNFETDKSYFKVYVNDLDFYKFLDMMFSKYHKELEDMILSRHTSYDGFISFYPNDIETWTVLKNKHELDYIHLETIFLTLLELEGEDFMWDLIEISQEVFYTLELTFENYQGEKYTYPELVEVVAA